MGIFDGCLLACDVDDTLVSSGFIHPKNIEKIKFFTRQGGVFSLASGRSAGALLTVVKSLDGCVSSSVTSNGAVIYDFKTEEILSEQTVPMSDYGVVESVAALDRPIAIEIHSQLRVLVVKRTEESDLHEQYENLHPEFVSFEEAKKLGWNKVVYICNSLADREFVRDFISQQQTVSLFVETCAFIDGRMRYYFEQLPCGITKAKGLTTLCEALGIQKGKLFAIGDYYNDIEMLKNADLSAATAESPESVREYANYVTVPCKEGAVADFIDYLTDRFKNT